MTKTFEQQIQDLEQITQKMSEPNLDLESGLNLFSQGTQISQSCQKILDKAEQKIKYILNQDEK